MNKEYPELEGTINLCNDIIKNKQTAVEYLIEEINKLVGIRIRMDEPIIEKALQMEKEQISNGYMEGFKYCYLYHIGKKDKVTPKNGEEYYNETYKTE